MESERATDKTVHNLGNGDDERLDRARRGRDGAGQDENGWNEEIHGPTRGFVLRICSDVLGDEIKLPYWGCVKGIENLIRDELESQGLMDGDSELSLDTTLTLAEE